jgi:pSer/pThr/pTyr-binding forkhead associated (FHA) protein
MPKLIFTDKNHVGQAYELILEKTTVGRDAQNTLVIPDSSVSAAHCEILTNGSEIIVRELGSRNGTVVNGIKLINQQSQLKSGQTVRFGSVEARLELGPPTSSEDTVSEITAVYSMNRIMREQQQRDPAQAKPPAFQKLESLETRPTDEHTVTSLTKPPLQTSPLPAFQKSAPPAKKNANKSSILVAVVIVLGLVLVLWLLWGRK